MFIEGVRGNGLRDRPARLGYAGSSPAPFANFTLRFLSNRHVTRSPVKHGSDHPKTQVGVEPKFMFGEIEARKRLSSSDPE